MKAVCAVFLCLLLTLPASAVDVPILMYHDFVEDSAPCGEYAVTESRFREHLSALSEAGYTSVTFEDLLEYTDGEDDLPEKPIIITADDGYTGVAEIAVPIAEEYGMTLTCAVIGGFAGGDGHFSLDHRNVGKMELVSHTFDLHYDDELGRGVERVSGEVLAEDCVKMRSLTDRFPMMDKVFIYPYGAYSDESEEVLEKLGYRVTVTCDRGAAKIEIDGDLMALPRIGVYQSMNAAALLAAVE